MDLPTGVSQENRIGVCEIRDSPTFPGYVYLRLKGTAERSADQSIVSNVEWFQNDAQ